MQCTHHPEAPAQALCTRCDQPLCSECSNPQGTKTFCPWCVEFLQQRAETRAAAAAPLSPAADASAPDGVYAGPGEDAEAPATGPSDVYAGPSDVYAGPSDAPPPAAGAPARAPLTAGAQVTSSVEVVGSMGRAVLFCAVAAALSIGIWYGVTVATEKVFALVAIGVGFLVGGAALAGAGRGGLDVGILSVGTYLVAILGGEFFSWRHLLARWAEDEGLGEADAALTLGEFATLIPSSFSIVGWIIVGFGAWEAFKITTRGH